MKAIDQLIKDMRERPHDFYCDEHCMTDARTKFVYWIANGFWSYHMWRPYVLAFSFIDKIKFHSALQRWKNAFAVQQASRGEYQ